VAVRLMKSVYYRVGASEGQAVRTNYLSEEGTGYLFHHESQCAVCWLQQGSEAAVSKDIVRPALYSDAIEVLRDGRQFQAGGIQDRRSGVRCQSGCAASQM
jgi:hypothetical protein